MTHAGVGYSGSEAAEAAARTAAESALDQAGVNRADLAVVFATTDYRNAYGEMLSTVSTVTGARNLVGCSGMGVLTTQGEFERQPGIAVLAVRSDAMSVEPFLVSVNPDTRDAALPAADIRNLADPSQKAHPLMMILPDVLSVGANELVQHIERDGGTLPIVGGAASGGGVQRETFQWCNTDIEVHGISGVLWGGQFTTHVGVAQGCEPIGEPGFITHCEGNLILEIDGRPTLEMLEEVFQELPDDERERATHNLFVGIAMEENASLRWGDFLVRNIIGMDPKSQGTAVAQLVQEGQTAQFQIRDARAARSDMHQMVSGLFGQTQGVKLHFGLCFNCLGRGAGLYGQPNHDLGVIKEFFGELPLTGFFGNGEIAPVGGRNYAHNYTAALVLFGER